MPFYTIAHLIMAWTFAFFLLQDTYNSSESHLSGVIFEGILTLLFLALAIKHRRKRPESTGETAVLVAYVISVIPFLMINIATMHYAFKPMREMGMVYLIPFLYSPPIFAVTFILSYAVLRFIRRRVDVAQ